MKKLIQGIVDFRLKVQKDYRESFGRLATGQKPDSLFIACSDSRVVPNIFASTNPGDLFVLRNVGNIVPPCGQDGLSASDESEAAAIEISVLSLKVSDIIVCGHSECAAMHALIDGRDKVGPPNLKSWLRHGDRALEELETSPIPNKNLTKENQLSQLNVLLQIKHILSYPVVKKLVDEKKLALHAWWFDLAHADVYAFEADQNQFVLIDEVEAARLIARLK